MQNYVLGTHISVCQFNGPIHCLATCPQPFSPTTLPMIPLTLFTCLLIFFLDVSCSRRPLLLFQSLTPKWCTCRNYQSPSSLSVNPSNTSSPTGSSLSSCCLSQSFSLVPPAHPNYLLISTTDSCHHIATALSQDSATYHCHYCCDGYCCYY